MLVAGQRVVPKRALDAGFAFKYPDINSALSQALSSGV
jgi:NAD dependent epimerase/dehydratase family enzyme